MYVVGVFSGPDKLGEGFGSSLDMAEFRVNDGFQSYGKHCSNLRERRPPKTPFEDYTLPKPQVIYCLYLLQRSPQNRRQTHSRSLTRPPRMSTSLQTWASVKLHMVQPIALLSQSNKLWWL